MPHITDAQLDAIYERGLRDQLEREQAAQLRWGLNFIDTLSRHGLLVAIDWQSTKDNTEALRRKVRIRWIEGSIVSEDLWHARNCERAS